MSARDDRQLKESVLAGLERDGVDPFGIDVDVVDGQILLTGMVNSHSERLNAHATVRGLAGSHTLVDRLIVRPLGVDWNVTAAEVTAGVEQTLRRAKVPHTGVGFSVTDRLVTLTGTVPDYRTRSILRHLVQNSAGVHFVDNQIVVLEDL
ncbi:hypothetical protein BH09ACT4_BH09ACT4_07110 [soil metagenome]